MIIFAYGSLINKKSLKKSAPSSKLLGPAIIKGHYRIFEVSSGNRFTKNKKSISVLNLKKSKNKNSIVNGIYFKVNKKNNLLKRENQYNLKKVKIWTLKGKISAFAFISKENNMQNFLFGDPIQKKYLEICKEGAKKLGPTFYKLFLKTTFIKNKNLLELKI